MAQGSWESRRRLKLNLVRLALAAMGAAFALAIRNAPFSFIDPARLSDASKQIADSLGPLDFLLAIPAVGDFLAARPQLGIALAGTLFIGLPAAALLARPIHDVFLAAFNGDVITRITREARIDTGAEARIFVALPWCLGSDGPRREAWQSLCQWANKDSGTERRGLLGRPAFRSLTTVALVGRSGSGKSRMAGEFARHLARRDVFGRAGRRGAVLLTLGAYWRRVLWFAPRRPDDPWDSGLLRQSVGEESFDQYLGRLRDWKPRRPTLLILDDPALGQTARIHEALAAASLGFRHPVRLLIVNQTITADSLYTYSDGEWLYEGRPADPPPILLPESAWFTDREVRELAFGSGVLDTKPERVKAAVRDRLHRISRGNPLLLELALEWLVDQEDLDGLSVHALRRRRIDRIIEALHSAGVRSPSQLGQLALATLAGGADRKLISAEAGRAGLFGTIQDLPSRSALQACFPADPLAAASTPRMVPPIRPELIADAFVDRILEEIGGDEAEALVRAALRLNPLEMLRQLGRPRPTGSLLADALGKIDVSKMEGIDPVDWAMAQAELAAFVQLDDWSEWSEPLQTLREERAVAAITRLDESQRREFVSRIHVRASRAPGDPRAIQILPHLLLKFACDAAADQPDQPIESWIAFLYSIRFQLDEWNESSAGSPKVLRHLTRSVADDFNTADRLMRRIWELGVEWKEKAIDFEALRPSGTSPEHQARSHCFGTADAAQRHDRDTYLARLEDLEKFAQAHHGSAEVQLLAVRAYRYAAYDWSRHHDLSLAAEMTADLGARAVRIERAFPESAAISREAAGTLGFHVRVLGRQGVAEAENARRFVAQIDAICRRFPDEYRHRALLARAYALETYAWQQARNALEARNCQAAAEKALAIFGSSFKGKAIGMATADAFKSATYAWSELPEGGAATEASAAADRTCSIVSGFPGDNVFHSLAAYARCVETYAWAGLPDGKASDKAHAIAREVLELARYFPANAEIQLHSATALQYVAWAYSNLPLGAGARQASALADQVMSIASKMPGRKPLQLQAIMIRRYEAMGWSHLPNGAGASRTAAAAAAARQVGMSDPDDLESHECVANTLAYVAFAYCQTPNGKQAANAGKAADEALELLRRFPASDVIHVHSADARKFEAIAWSKMADGEGAEQAEAAAAQVEAIVARFPDNLLLQRIGSEACRAAVTGWSLVPDGAGAAKATEIADRIALIAAGRRDDRDILVSEAKAREFEASAWSRFPGPAARTGARLAADKADAIARTSPFPELLEHRNAAHRWAKRAERIWTEARSGAEDLT